MFTEKILILQEGMYVFTEQIQILQEDYFEYHRISRKVPPSEQIFKL